MLPVVIYGDSAKEDLRHIFSFYQNNFEQAQAEEAMVDILEEIERLAVTPMLGMSVKNKPNFKEWYFKKRQVKIYFQRLDTNAILVVRVWGAKRNPLRPQDIEA
jgi:plasmid stabilization system protein ParE